MAQQACIYHRRGLCRYGDACKYSHSETAQLPVCTFFQGQGNCRNGENCMFAHVLPKPGASSRKNRAGRRQPAGPPQAGRQPPAAPAQAAVALDDCPPPLEEDVGPTTEELCRCSACGWHALSGGGKGGPVDLLAHLQAKHPGEPQLAEQLRAKRQCPECKKTLKSFQSLSGHMCDVHLSSHNKGPKMQGAGGQGPNRPPAGFGLLAGDWDYGGSDSSYEDEWEERMDNFGFTRDDVNELLCQGVKPWEEDAWDVLAYLHDPY